MNRGILLHPNDTVATLLAPAKCGDRFMITDTAGVECGYITVTEEIPFAHKVAVKTMRQGDRVIKMNVTIGVATSEILPGSYAHVHNIESIEGRRAVK